MPAACAVQDCARVPTKLLSQLGSIVFLKNLLLNFFSGQKVQIVDPGFNWTPREWSLKFNSSGFNCFFLYPKDFFHEVKVYVLRLVLL